MKTIILSVVIFVAVNLKAQAPDTLWTKSFGGTNIDVAHDVRQTADGGYIIAGYTRSFGNMSGRNLWLVKTDSSGNEEWNSALGGNDDEEAYSVVQTPDGGYTVAGYTKSFGLGMKDVILIKTDSTGTSEWIRTFGGAQDDEGYCLQQTADGGYIVAGVTSSSGAGSRDMWLIKTNDFGNEEWNQTLGGFSSDGAWSVQQTTDGGYILTGWTFSNGPGYLGNAWLVKTDSTGTEEWNRTFGGDDADRGYSVQQTTDGGYILTGYTSSFGAGLDDMLLIKTDSLGNEEWNKTFGGNGRDYGNFVQQIRGGGYIVTGYTLSFGAGGDDVWAVRTNSSGIEEWSSTYGGPYSDVGFAIRQVSDGGFIVAGHTLSFGAGLHDAYLIRIAPETAPVFAVAPDTIIFSNAIMGNTLVDSVRVQNTGSSNLVIDSVISSQAFLSASPFAATLAPDSTAWFYVQFYADTVAGSQSGAVLFYHNGASSPDSVTVLGEVITGIDSRNSKIAQKFNLHQNYPNPFNPVTTIKFELPQREYVALKVYNALGQEVATLIDGVKAAGSYKAIFDGARFSSGVYYYKITAGNFSSDGKMLLLK